MWVVAFSANVPLFHCWFMYRVQLRRNVVFDFSGECLDVSFQEDATSVSVLEVITSPELSQR